MEEYFWDGGVVNITTNNVASFTRLTPIGGYPYKITPNGDSPFPADTPCLAGTGGWEKVSFDLQDFAGKSVKVRFRFGSDKYTVERGWFIDDIRFSWRSDWLTLSAITGTVDAGTSQNLSLTIDSSQLQLGDYYDSISLISNDPTTTVLTVPVTLFVVMDSGKVHIKSDENNPNGFIISWLADASHSYSLVTSTNLISDTWTGIPGYTNMPGINGIMSYTGTVDSVSSKFYKVEESPL
jgi:bacillopeptidase F (M6 metalloprotease family)